MIPLFILLGSFIVVSTSTRYFTKQFNFPLAGRIALSVTLLFTASGHFAFTQGMALMIPDFIPYKKEAVLYTGLLEIAAAIGLLVPRLRKLTAWLLIVFLIVILPANVNAAIKNIDYKTGTNTGNGVAYLWFRVPLQAFLVAWTYFFGVKMKGDRHI